MGHGVSSERENVASTPQKYQQYWPDSECIHILYNIYIVAVNNPQNNNEEIKETPEYIYFHFCQSGWREGTVFPYKALQAAIEHSIIAQPLLRM